MPETMYFEFWIPSLLLWRSPPEVPSPFRKKKNPREIKYAWDWWDEGGLAEGERRKNLRTDTLVERSRKFKIITNVERKINFHRLDSVQNKFELCPTHTAIYFITSQGLSLRGVLVKKLFQFEASYLKLGLVLMQNRYSLLSAML